MRTYFLAALSLIIVLLLAFYLMLAFHRDTSKPSVRVLAVSARSLPLYSMLEVDLEVKADYENPFDPDEIDVQLVVELPSGRKVAVPAFYYQEYRRDLVGSREELRPVGDPHWKARFTPFEVGKHVLYAIVRDRWGNEAKTEPFTVEVTPSALPGFVRVSAKDPRFFEFSNGSSTFFIGLNVCWSGERGTYDYDEWIPKMAAAGVNLIRLWMAPWRFGIEWKELGRYDLAEAWRLDYVMRLAERYGIYVILCLANHGQLSTKVTPQWSDNPYNAKNGGPISKPEEFWVSEEAKKLFKKRLRYIVARWGYSTHLLAWELWNEVDLTDNYRLVRDAVAEWHREMATYLKSIDPYDHLVTTSFSNPQLDPAVWKLDEIDFVTLHRYGPLGFTDVANAIHDLVRIALDRYRKPVVVTEFGIDWRWWGEPLYYADREGVGLHDGLWAAVMAGSPATAMHWWWDNYVHPYNLYYHFEAVARFLKGVNPVESNFKPIRWSTLPPREPELGDVELHPSLGWAKPESNVFTIRIDGTIEGDLSQLSAFIHGKAHPELRNNPRFKVEFPEGGRVLLRVNSVSRAGAVAAIFIDGTPVKIVELPDKDGSNDAFAGEYELEIAVDVPPGFHEIAVDNLGADWFSWDYIRFEKAVIRQLRVKAYGLSNGTFAILWIKNPEYAWWELVRGGKVQPVRGARLLLQGFVDGDYEIEVWDTRSGKVVNAVSAEALNGSLILELDELLSDVAVKIKRRETVTRS